MSACLIKLNSICEGGNHYTISVSGAVNRTITVDINEIPPEINDSDVDAFIAVVLKIALQDRSEADLRPLLETGIVLNT